MINEKCSKSPTTQVNNNCKTEDSRK